MRPLAGKQTPGKGPQQTQDKVGEGPPADKSAATVLRKIIPSRRGAVPRPCQDDREPLFGKEAPFSPPVVMHRRAHAAPLAALFTSPHSTSRITRSPLSTMRMGRPPALTFLVWSMPRMVQTVAM